MYPPPPSPVRPDSALNETHAAATAASTALPPAREHVGSGLSGAGMAGGDDAAHGVSPSG